MIERYGITRLEKVGKTPRWSFDIIKDGDWVKWEDVAYLIENPNRHADECNCEHNIETTKHVQVQGSDYWWICPAHGYKRK